MNFEGKVVVITGASGGIGRATARLFAKYQANLTLVDYNKEALAILPDELSLREGKYLAIHADVSKEHQVQDFVRQTIETFGRIDVLFNNAGIAPPDAPIEEILEEDFNRVMEVNIKGVYLGMKHVVPMMKKQKSGSIINTSSVAGLKVHPNMSSYAASKHAVIGMTKTVALECAHYGVRVNAICPGPINTSMIQAFETTMKITHLNPVEKKRFLETHLPMGRYGEPEEIAEVVTFLASDKASYMTGGIYTICGGVSLG
jgi:NAD(P)-dependent dehydrogenase (short-subunit alcohol dehydrogenase family)